MHPSPMFCATHVRLRRGQPIACVAVLLLTSIGSLAAADHAHAVAETPDWSTEATVTYQPPVDAPVTDPFRPPLTPYGPGNRGIDYATEPGTSVRVAADGIVVFAGPVAGGLHVTVLHADGIRTTYSYLAVIRVRERQALRSAEVVGVTGATLHVGARRGDIYIDPALLWGRSTGPPVVHLVPLDGFEPLGETPVLPGSDMRLRRSVVIADLARVAARGATAVAAGVGRAPT